VKGGISLTCETSNEMKPAHLKTNQTKPQPHSEKIYLLSYQSFFSLLLTVDSRVHSSSREFFLAWDKVLLDFHSEIRRETIAGTPASRTGS